MQLQTGQVFAGRYRLLAKIGMGGFSEVWRVADEMAEDTEMVLKVYAPERGLDEHGIKLFRREYSITANLNHPNLLKASYFDISDGSPFLIMPYCAGGSLYGKMMEAGTVSEREVADMLVHICGALQHLHKKGIIHQDIKPDNVLIHAHGSYMLTDFGISSRLRSTMQKSTTMPKAMTIAYSPPEKFKGTANVGPEGDIFSLGVMIYELLTGNLPWSGMGGAYLTPSSEPPALDEQFAPGLQPLIASCLAYDPAERPTAADIAEQAKQFLSTGTWGNAAPTAAATPHRTGRETTLMDTAPAAPPAQVQHQAAQSPVKTTPQASPAPVKQDSNKMVWSIVGVAVLLLVAFVVWITIGNNSQSEIANTNKPAKEQPVVNTTTDSSKTKAPTSPKKEAEQPTKTDETPTVKEEPVKSTPNETAVNAPKRYKLAHKYESARNFSEGLAGVKYNDKWGFINKNGEEVIGFKYSGVGDFKQGLAVVHANGKWGFIDKNGREVIPLKYNQARDFNEDGWAVVEQNGKLGYIDKTGRVVVDIKYEMYNYFNLGTYGLKLNGKWGCVDKSGKVVVPFKYDWFQAFREGLAGLELNGKYGFVDENGQTVVDFKYDDLGFFSEGLAKVVLQGNCGYIDKNGNEVIALKYTRAGEFNNGLAPVKQGNKWGYIDRSGKVIVPFNYETAYDFKDGLAAVELNGKRGIINKKGQVVLGFKYDDFTYFKEGLAKVAVNGKCGFYNARGKEVIPLKYEKAEAFNEGLAAVMQYGAWFFVDAQGNEVLYYY